MLKLLLVAPENNNLDPLASALSVYDDLTLDRAESGAKALERVSHTPYDLVILDEKLDDMTGLQLAEKIVQTNAMINCAAVSDLSAEDFHEASEGLGLVAQLPSRPKRGDAETLLAKLKTVLGLGNPSA